MALNYDEIQGIRCPVCKGPALFECKTCHRFLNHIRSRTPRNTTETSSLSLDYLLSTGIEESIMIHEGPGKSHHKTLAKGPGQQTQRCVSEFD